MGILLLPYSELKISVDYLISFSSSGEWWLALFSYKEVGFESKQGPFFVELACCPCVCRFFVFFLNTLTSFYCPCVYIPLEYVVRFCLLSLIASLSSLLAPFLCLCLHS